MVTGAILFVLTLCNLFRTACSDPGIIPRASDAEADHIEKYIRDEEIKTGKLNKPRTKIGKEFYIISWFPAHRVFIFYFYVKFV